MGFGLVSVRDSGRQKVKPRRRADICTHAQHMHMHMHNVHVHVHVYAWHMQGRCMVGAYREGEPLGSGGEREASASHRGAHGAPAALPLELSELGVGATDVEAEGRLQVLALDVHGGACWMGDDRWEGGGGREEVGGGR